MECWWRRGSEIEGTLLWGSWLRIDIKEPPGMLLAGPVSGAVLGAAPLYASTREDQI